VRDEFRAYIGNVHRELLVVVGLAGCATHYRYQFQLADPGNADTFEDALVKAHLVVDGDAIRFELTNKTDETLQVEWNRVRLDRGDGTTTALHPATDLGWITAGATATTELVPLAFPHVGDAAAAYQNRTLELAVPVIIKREPSTYRFHFTVHVQPE
jgi:hypothetical protein